MIIIVGDEPSKKNACAGIPLIGTPSWDRLKPWLDKWGVKSYMLLNSHNGYWYQKIKEQAANPNNTFLCLGLKAYAKVRKAKAAGKIIKVPHPSPRNRSLNNKEYVSKMVARVKRELTE